MCKAKTNKCLSLLALEVSFLANLGNNLGILSKDRTFGGVGTLVCKLVKNMVLLNNGNNFTVVFFGGVGFLVINKKDKVGVGGKVFKSNSKRCEGTVNPH